MNVRNGVHKQMANNFVKWWKTKFLNGYRQFTADGHENRISDTEELLGSAFCERESLDRSRTSCCTTPFIDSKTFNNTTDPLTLPDNQSSETQQQSKDQLNLEEFSCDVSLEGGIDKKGQERQEFSFTLYDFDGYGKITKDDIAGLVTTIYEALGSSVKVPHYGSKTIRVKLTVSPDQRKHVSATVINQNDNINKNIEETSRIKRDLNVTIKHKNNNKSRCRNEKKRQSSSTTTTNATLPQHHCCEHEYIGNVSDDSSEVFSQVTYITSEDEGECHTEEAFSRCQKTRQRLYKTHSNNLTKESTTTTTTATSKKQDALKIRKQKRSSSLQRQELLEIIQANMDKNNFSLQTPRKHCNNHVTEKSEIKHQRRTKNMPTLHYLADIVDPEHFYVDLASFQNATNLPQTPCQYNKLIDAVMCVSNRKVPVKKTTSCKRNIKMKNHELTQSTTLYQALPSAPNKDIKSNKNIIYKISDVDGKNVKKTNKKIPQIVLGHTSSPHHLRHRNRQEDQARAMAQVVRWLEQEFSSNLHTTNENKSNKNNTTRSTNYEKYTNTSSTPTNSSIERHEHHHVHEHIHHHYHHYQETPIVV